MQQRLIPTDRLTQQTLEAGSGPLVLLIHGFPELGVSWRAQVEALAAAGYRAAAPDMPNGSPYHTRQQADRRGLIWSRYHFGASPA